MAGCFAFEQASLRREAERFFISFERPAAPVSPALPVISNQDFTGAGCGPGEAACACLALRCVPACLEGLSCPLRGGCGLGESDRRRSALVLGLMTEGAFVAAQARQERGGLHKASRCRRPVRPGLMSPRDAGSQLRVVPPDRQAVLLPGGARFKHTGPAGYAAAAPCSACGEGARARAGAVCDAVAHACVRSRTPPLWCRKRACCQAVLPVGSQQSCTLGKGARRACPGGLRSCPVSNRRPKTGSPLPRHGPAAARRAAGQPDPARARQAARSCCWPWWPGRRAARPACWPRSRTAAPPTCTSASPASRSPSCPTSTWTTSTRRSTPSPTASRSARSVRPGRPPPSAAPPVRAPAAALPACGGVGAPLGVAALRICFTANLKVCKTTRVLPSAAYLAPLPDAVRMFACCIGHTPRFIR